MRNYQSHRELLIDEHDEEGEGEDMKNKLASERVRLFLQSNSGHFQEGDDKMCW